MDTRKGSADLCQDCYAVARPDRYFPETFRTGHCAGCDADTFVGRVSQSEARRAQDAYDRATVAAGWPAVDDCRDARGPLAPHVHYAPHAPAGRHPATEEASARMRGEVGTRPLVTPEEGQRDARWIGRGAGLGTQPDDAGARRIVR